MQRGLTGGLDPASEHFLTDRPANPQMRESATLWVMDEAGLLALPRVTIDAIGEDWDNPGVQLNMALADGRAFKIWGSAPRPAEVWAARLVAGPLAFECLEPFKCWRVTFAGEAEQTTAECQRQGLVGGRPAKVKFDLTAEMAASPWLMGGMTLEAARLLSSSVEGALMGGLRYEQLCRVAGYVEVEDERYEVNGTGMRVRRRGVRNMGAATGHCQHSALFPSGRALGAISFAPRTDGAPSFNEGFVIDGEGRKHAARVAEAPWMTRLIEKGEAVPLLLETDAGQVRIESETVLSTFDHHYFEMADSSVLQQGAARYVWDGEETMGLIERCTLRHQLRDL